MGPSALLTGSKQAAQTQCKMGVGGTGWADRANAELAVVTVTI